MAKDDEILMTSSLTWEPILWRSVPPGKSHCKKRPVYAMGGDTQSLKTACPNFTKFSTHVNCDRGSVLWRRYVLLTINHLYSFLLLYLCSIWLPVKTVMHMLCYYVVAGCVPGGAHVRIRLVGALERSVLSPVALFDLPSIYCCFLSGWFYA